jgi:hypothetical protein
MQIDPKMQARSFKQISINALKKVAIGTVPKVRERSSRGPHFQKIYGTLIVWRQGCVRLSSGGISEDRALS